MVPEAYIKPPPTTDITPPLRRARLNACSTMSPIAATEADDAVAFIVGAGRSGTTLLHKLLCLHPQVAYTSNYEHHLWWLPVGFVHRLMADRIETRRRAWFDPAGNAYFVDRPLLSRWIPAPAEGESVYARCGIPLIPQPGYRAGPQTADCLRQAFARIRRRAGARLVIAKCTANNRRIPVLDTAFPEARYIHLIRDGRDVACSLSRVAWWNQHTVWWDGRTAAQMEHDGTARSLICARNWVRELEAVFEGLSPIADDRVLQIRYEALVREPLSQLEAILAFLGLGATPSYRRAVQALNLQRRTGDRACDWTPEERRQAQCEQQAMLARLGYR